MEAKWTSVGTPVPGSAQLGIKPNLTSNSIYTGLICMKRVNEFPYKKELVKSYEVRFAPTLESLLNHFEECDVSVVVEHVTEIPGSPVVVAIPTVSPHAREAQFFAVRATGQNNMKVPFELKDIAQ